MRKVRRVLLVLTLIIIMFVSIITSVDNGSPVGNALKKSGIIAGFQTKYHKIMDEVLKRKYDEIYDVNIK